MDLILILIPKQPFLQTIRKDRNIINNAKNKSVTLTNTTPIRKKTPTMTTMTKTLTTNMMLPLIKIDRYSPKTGSILRTSNTMNNTLNNTRTLSLEDLRTRTARSDTLTRSLHMALSLGESTKVRIRDTIIESALSKIHLV
jgi:hypothetical protein